MRFRRDLQWRTRSEKSIDSAVGQVPGIEYPGRPRVGPRPDHCGRDPGPSGLAAAVYAASEGLDALLLETSTLGGQAGSSSKIENYLGFPTGISGQELAGRALTQAIKFGADIMVRPRRAAPCHRRPYQILLEDDTKVAARTVVIATGAQYKRPELPTSRNSRAWAFIMARPTWRPSSVKAKT